MSEKEMSETVASKTVAKLKGKIITALTRITKGDFTHIDVSDNPEEIIESIIGGIYNVSITNKWYEEYYVHYSGHNYYPVKSGSTKTAEDKHQGTKDKYKGRYGEHNIELARAIIKGLEEVTLIIQHSWCPEAKSNVFHLIEELN